MAYIFKKFTLGYTTPIAYPEYQNKFNLIIEDILSQYPSYFNVVSKSLIPIITGDDKFILIYDSLLYMDSRLTEESDFEHQIKSIESKIDGIIEDFFNSEGIIFTKLDIN